MKRATKYILIIAVIILVILASAVSVYAYLSDQGVKENTFTVGNNSVKVDEEFTPPPELTEGDNPFVKKVRVANTGNVPCYVRVFFDFSDSAVKEKAKISANEADIENLDADTWYSYDEYIEHLPEGWVYVPLTGEGGDELLGGYFYYTTPLEVGGNTPYLFEAVNAYFEHETDVTDFEIIISVDSVQTTDSNGNEFTGDDAWKQAWTQFLNGRNTPSTEEPGGEP